MDSQMLKDFARKLDNLSEFKGASYDEITGMLEKNGFELVEKKNKTDYQDKSIRWVEEFWGYSENTDMGVKLSYSENGRVWCSPLNSLRGEKERDEFFRHAYLDSAKTSKINSKRIKDDDFADDDEEEEVEWDIDEDSPELFEAVADECGCDEEDAKKIVAVARLNGDSFDDVKGYAGMGGYSCSGNEVEIGSNQGYYVFDDYNEAEEAALQDIKNLIDDMGLQSFSKDFQETILDNYIEEDWFESAMQEYYQSYAEDISNESSDEYNNRLIEEAIDNGVITEDDLDEDGEYKGDYYDLEYSFAEEICSNNAGYDYASEWYRAMLGDEDFYETIKSHDLIDWDKVADECLRLDGVAHSLARYDGGEDEIDVDGTTYYIYRYN